MQLILQMLKGYFKTAYKIAIILIVCFAVINLFLYSINKGRPDMSYDPVDDLRIDLYKTINNPELKKTDQGKLAIVVTRMATCTLMGEACTDNPKDGDINYKNSLFGKLAGAVSIPYANPPASGIYWAYSGLQNAGFAPKTFAAEGIGFAALKPLTGIWKLFRDLAFSVLVVYLIVIGLLIMFRFKINPQTVINLENSLPRIFITLILITFSFAIAGFMIDLMYVTSALAVSIVGGYSPTGPGGEQYLSLERQASLVTSGGFMRLFDEVFWNFNIIRLGWDFFAVAPLAVNIALRFIVGFIAVMLLRSTPLDDLITGRVADIPTWAAGIPKLILGSYVWLFMIPFFAYVGPMLLGILIMVTTGLFLFIRILALLFSAYLRILINTLFAPMILLLGVLPGRSMVGNWLKMLLADLIVFPVVMVMIVLAGVMTKIPVEDGSFWQPPFLFSSIYPGAFRAILSIGIMFLIPQVVKNMRGLLGVKPSSFGFGAGIFLAGMTGIGAGGLGALSKYGSIAHVAAPLSRLPIVGSAFGKIAGSGGGHGGGGGGGGAAAHSVGGRWSKRLEQRKTDIVSKKLSSSGPSE